MTGRPTARQKSARLCSGSSERTAAPKCWRAIAAVQATPDALAPLKTPCSFHERLVDGPASPRRGWASAPTNKGTHPGPSSVPLSTRITTAASVREASRLKQAGGPCGLEVPHCRRLASLGSVLSAADRVVSGPSGSSTTSVPFTPPARSDCTVSTRRTGSAWAWTPITTLGRIAQRSPTRVARPSPNRHSRSEPPVC